MLKKKKTKNTGRNNATCFCKNIVLPMNVKFKKSNVSQMHKTMLMHTKRLLWHVVERTMKPVRQNVMNK